MKKSKIIAIVFACMMLAAMLAGCQSPAPAAPEQPSTPAEPGEATPAPAPDSGLSGEITVWDIWPTDTDSNSRGWHELLPQFDALHPDLTVNVESTQNEQYKDTKFPAAQAANAFPDVFFGWGPAYARDLAAAGMILPLNAYLDDEYMSTVQPGSLDNFTFDGNIYGLTMYNWTAVLYCNTELFDKYGIALPTTYDEYFDVIAAFNAEGIVPMALPAQDPWTIAFFQHIIAIRYAGADNVNAMLKGEKSFDDPGIVDSAQALLDLVAANAFSKNALGEGYDDATERFMQGEFPMLYMGDWMIGDIDGANTDTGEYKPVAGKIVGINFPAVGGPFDKQILGGATDGFMVSANSQNPDAAVEFVKWMTARLPELSYKIGGAIPTRTNFDMAQYAADLPALSVSVAEFAAKADGATLAWDTFLPKEPTARMLSMFQELIGQKITAEDFAKNMAKAMEDGGYTSY